MFRWRCVHLGRFVVLRKVGSSPVSPRSIGSTFHHATHASLGPPRKQHHSNIPLLASLGVAGSAVWALSATSDAQGENATMSILEDWVVELANKPGMKRVGSPGQTLATNPISQMLLETDHMFEEMMRVEMVKGIECFFDTAATEFHAAIKLGRNVCGYPTTVHGGLTAAIMDETLGGLMVWMWQTGKLGLLPAVTARLEVDYCKKVPQGSSLLCTTKLESVEGRKLWMVAELKDRPGGTIYATGRALFVMPKLSSVVRDYVKGLWRFS